MFTEPVFRNMLALIVVDEPLILDFWLYRNATGR
jgi:hypothetical protein